MNSDSFQSSEVQLKVFKDESNVESGTEIFEQLPVLKSMVERFEMVTGWKLDFVESKASFRERQFEPEDNFIFGDLEISDMSGTLAPGVSARHRGYCDQLVETLDAMVKMIQLDRQRIRDFGTQLNPVVQPPFEWWGLQGNSGFKAGTISHWSVTTSEQLRLFCAKLNGSDRFEISLASSALLAAFDAICQSSTKLYDVAPALPSLIRRLGYDDMRIESFATVEMDPITGEYKLDGFNAVGSLALVDVDAGAVIDMGENESEGILYSGQVLCVGINDQQRQLIQRLLSREMTVDQCLGLVQQGAPEAAMISLHRR